MTEATPPLSPVSPPRIGVLLVNLGTPAAPTAGAVRRYLAEFLSDPRVIETPRWLWWPILHGVILRLRPARSARAYASIWTAQGSPLLVNSQALAQRLRHNLMGENLRVELAMRYGKPGLDAAIERLHREGVRHLLIVPLYPQYTAATTGSAFDAATDALQRLRWPPELRFINDYHDDPNYIGALATRVQDYWREHGRAQRLLLSFHGLPQRCVDAGDPYFDQCQATATLLRERLGLGADEIAVSFQSRVGREPWLQPYTDELLQRWRQENLRHVQVLSPGFAVDCLETLEEIAIRYREQFLAAGGERLDYIPALNDDAAHVHALANLIRRHSQGWPESLSTAGTPVASA